MSNYQGNSSFQANMDTFIYYLNNNGFSNSDLETSRYIFQS